MGWMQYFVSGVVTDNGEVTPGEEQSAPQNPPMDGNDWVELFVREMMSSSNVDDARARASRVLEVLERSICARARTEATQNFHQVVYFTVISVTLIVVTTMMQNVIINSHIVLSFIFFFSLVDGRNEERSAGGARAVSGGVRGWTI